ncbi:hypothetical protein PHYPSEUDO_006290 [Phytophthora pseudosyringae]|uniref:Dolichyl-diphosphooligosaccharide--protein glycosyltransferase subunit 1 n=1 Tax=Phytophthora pseudosyringae TaxID=221518 RepID=A0A8T1VPA1_9STRA|nr:hypothetical protein PHYPSEUDO_006290 [Phytophthora pseudosyringae]
MRRWSALLGVLAVGGLGANASSQATFAIWPQHIDATLSLSVDADGASVVEASHGGALGSFNVKIETQSEVPLDPLLDAIEITWVPAADAHSSTFDQILASSSRFDSTNAVGIHLQAKLRDGASWRAINETHHERIEENIRGILQNTLPSIEILPGLSKGFLAKSLCDFRAWKTSNPLQEILREPAAESPSICYSSSFPFLLKDEGVSFYNSVVREAKRESINSGNSVFERALYETKRDFRAAQHEHRLAVVIFGRGSASSANVEAEYLEAWVARGSNARPSWRAAISVSKTMTNVLAVTSIARELGLSKLELVWLQRDAKPIVLASAPSILEIQVPKAAEAASLQATITGEGFHRRYVMEVKVLESRICGGTFNDSTILVRVPISNTAYIDLDEIRRMERFGELRLLSFTKHIEIERPSPVSSQHVVGLEFTMPASNQAQFEFPIHFRYQAPSDNELYRQASVIAPEMFLFCRDGDSSAMEKVKLSNDDAVQGYLRAWGLSGHATSRSDTHWLRLVTLAPAAVTEVLTPVGYLPSDWLVSSVTLLFASVGAVILLWVSVGVGERAQSPNWKSKAD